MNKHNEKFAKTVQHNYDLYKGIDSDEFIKRHYGVSAIIRAAAPLGSTAVVAVTALITIGAQGGHDGPVMWHTAMLTVVALAGLVATRNRGTYGQTAEQGNKGKAQLGAARAGPRKARARTGIERGG
ncbi:hypothetical protein [Sorangium sp. So ce131]|uniref:hypothetical protein n=1 Tax=Sorangium sp. So ce131 TaxID=3133282 RepID=UPI003F641518